MTTLRACVSCLAMLAVLSACATSETYRDPPTGKPHCAKPSQGGDEDTDGGVGGTGRTPEDCDEDLRSD